MMVDELAVGYPPNGKKGFFSWFFNLINKALCLSPAHKIPQSQIKELF